MRGDSSMRRGRPTVLQSAVLASFWVGLWGVINPATVVSGLVLGAVLSALSPHRTTGATLPIPTLRAGWRLLADTVQSNAAMARAVVAGPGHVTERYDRVPLELATPDEEPLVSLAVTFTPGTIVVGSTAAPPFEALVHSLNLTRDQVHEQVRRTEHVMADLDGRLTHDPDLEAPS